MLDAMQKMWDHGSQGEYFTFVNAGTKRIINSLIKTDGNIRINTEQGLNQVLGITVQKIESDFGTLNLVLDRHMDANTMLILDLDQVGEENLWGNIWTWLDGINIECKDIQNAYVNPDNLTMADDTKENYQNTGFTMAKAGGWVSKFGYDAAHPYLFLPTECKGASNFVGAQHWENHNYNGFLVALLGGRWYDGGYCSPFYLDVNTASGYRARHIGGRLLYVPQADKPKYLYAKI